ncbi:MAG: 3-hydroxyacyl-CoA dehydrogenase [Bacilli bacterium]|nr:3-hydroxyacyl-CoA dehydrogenase [Bacilli bacterium]
MDFKNIVVIGGGVLGSQIAFQSAYSGFNVIILTIDEKSKEDINNKLRKLAITYKKELDNMVNLKDITKWPMGISSYDGFNYEKCMDKLNTALSRITLETNQKEALKNADLVIESITENLKAKQELFKQIAEYLPERTVIVTNSSTLLPSKMAKFTKRPDKFLALHFANNIWKNNLTEVMAQDKTNKKYFEDILIFASNIRMIPVPIYKEKSGYLLNSMLVPFLFSALDLLVNGISDCESIDKAWTLGTGAPNGPFRILDTVGLETAYNIVKMYVKVPKFMAPYNFKGMAKYLEKMIGEGKTGKAAGEGFYKYE